MKKTAIIICFISIFLGQILLYYIYFKLKKNYKDGSEMLIFMAITHLLISLPLLIYTMINVDSYNQTLLGILLIIFVCIPGGILIICMPREDAGYNSNNYNKRIIDDTNNSSQFSKIMNQHNFELEGKYKTFFR